MYVNNISERSSSRVLQQPGGRQTHNIFGGDDTPEPVQQRGVRRGPPQQSAQEPLPAPPQTQAPPASQVSQASQVAAGARKVESEQPVQRQAARSVNNIWGSDEDVAQKPSTRVNSRPGGDSSGVAGALGTEQPVEHKYRSTAGRSNQTSDNSPFSSAPMPAAESQSAANRAKQVSDDSPFSNQAAPVRSSTRVTHAPGGQSSNIISWQ